MIPPHSRKRFVDFWPVSSDSESSDSESESSEPKQKTRKTTPSKKDLMELPEDIIRNCFEFVGCGNYRFLAGVSKAWKTEYKKIDKVTFFSNGVATVPCFNLFLSEFTWKNRKECKGNVSNNVRLHPNDMLMYYASKNGNFLMFMHGLFNHYRLINDDDGSRFNCVELAASGGHLDVVSNALMHMDSRGQWGEGRALRMACENGHIDVVNFMIERIKKWEVERGRVRPSCWKQYNSRCLEGAARNGHLQILIKFHESDLDFENSFNLATCDNAARGGHIDILKWLKNNIRAWSDWSGSTSTCLNAGRGGHFDILKWLYHENRFEMDKHICTCAALHGNLDILKWAILHGCEMDEKTCEMAAFKGHLHILKWARKYDCPWDKTTCAKRARKKGHLEIVEWIDAQL